MYVQRNNMARSYNIFASSVILTAWKFYRMKHLRQFMSPETKQRT
jgi:hypothetical protein